MAEAINVVGLGIELMAALVITYGSLETFVVVVGLLVRRIPLVEGRRHWLRFLQLLVVGLTFQLAADLLHTTIAEGWEPLGHVAVIAVIRTFLAYFLNRDLQEAREPV